MVAIGAEASETGTWPRGWCPGWPKITGFTACAARVCMAKMKSLWQMARPWLSGWHNIMSLRAWDSRVLEMKLKSL